METIQCEVCPNINITHENGTVVAVKYCVLEAALKHTKERFPICGRDLELQLTEAPSPSQELSDAQIDDALQLSGIEPEVVEAELVE